MKDFIRKTILIVLSIYLLYCSYFFLTNAYKTYLDCGKVVSKSNDELNIKHGTRTILYLNIEFEKSGFKSIESEPTLYFSKKVGDNVCFDLDYNYSKYDIFKMVIGLASCFLILSATIVIFIGWLFNLF